MEITITRNPNPVPKPNPATLGFGKYFTDHMFLMDYKDGAWRDARIVPFGPLPLHPASTTLHYGAEIFEGMKAYRRPDGQIQLFRPEENFRRMNSSAERICLPTLRRGRWRRWPLWWCVAPSLLQGLSPSACVGVCVSSVLAL